jgi:hypothetical protein
MSITSGAAALMRLAHLRATSGGSSAGRAVRTAALVIALPAAYLAGGRRSQSTEQAGHAGRDDRAQLDRIAELERRIEQLERLQRDAAEAQAAKPREPRHLRAVSEPAPLDKDRAAMHYEVLASQLACERQIVEIEDRLAAVERTGDGLRTTPVWLASTNGVPAGLRRRG